MFAPALHNAEMKPSVGDITKSGHNKICEAPHLDRLESLRVSVTEVQRKFAVETMPGHKR